MPSILITTTTYVARSITQVEHTSTCIANFDNTNEAEQALHLINEDEYNALPDNVRQYGQRLYRKPAP